MNSTRIELIRQKLTTAFAPVTLDIIDESHKHAGHEGAKSGGGHFVAYIVSDAFAGKSLLQRHRMVFDALSEEMKTEIHALSIKANTPAEVSSK